MSIIMGALGGAGAAMEDVFGARLKSDMARENELAVGQQRSDLETQRLQTLEVFKNNLQLNTSNQLRTEQTNRIDAAAGNIVQPGIDQKRGQIRSSIDDQSNWTPEQQASVDQSLALDRSNAVTDPRVRTQAAIATGDIDPKTAATLTSHADIQQMKNDSTMKEIENKILMAKDKTETQMAIAELKAHLIGNGKAPSGYRFREDGGLEAIPGGPAADGKPLTDSQSKALLFGSRMRDADKILTQLASEGTTTSVPGSKAPLIGGLITALSSENKQMLEQAKLDFMTAVLRRESGAAISTGEFESANRQYFPQIGDSEKVIAQKAANRKLALKGVLMEVPAQQRNSLLPDEKPSGIRSGDGDLGANTPDVSNIEAEMRRRGLLK